jgi:hypothetical protein
MLNVNAQNYKQTFRSFEFIVFGFISNFDIRISDVKQL